MRPCTVSAVALLFFSGGYHYNRVLVACWEGQSYVTRRTALAQAWGLTSAAHFLDPGPAKAVEDASVVATTDVYHYENRDRQGNRQSVIREDYWYMMGKTPPRLLTAPLKGDDPQWNAFGSCQSDAGGNSCTYVALSQRIPAYSKYGYAIAYGARDYQKLGQLLQEAVVSSDTGAWNQALALVTAEERAVPPPIIDAELKMVLLATALLTSPNFPGPSRELLVARFYANEARFAAREMRDALLARDASRAWEAWRFGQDSWNSYFQVVNRAIVPKVGDKFQLIV